MSHRISNEFYKANNESNNPGYRVGKGMGSAGPIWISTADPMLAMMRENYPGVIFTHPARKRSLPG